MHEPKKLKAVKNSFGRTLIYHQETDEFYKQPTFYAMAHAAKFIQRGSSRVETFSAVAGVEAAATVQLDGVVTVLVLNR